eukprot:7271737-Prymnesium_polylepis.1
MAHEPRNVMLSTGSWKCTLYTCSGETDGSSTAAIDEQKPSRLGQHMLVEGRSCEQSSHCATAYP